MATEIKELKKLSEFRVSESANIITKIIQDGKGNKHLDIRKYYLSDAGKWLPTKKGIWLPLEDEDDNTAKNILSTVLEDLEEFENE